MRNFLVLFAVICVLPVTNLPMVVFITTMALMFNSNRPARRSAIRPVIECACPPAAPEEVCPPAAPEICIYNENHIDLSVLQFGERCQMYADAEVLNFNIGSSTFLYKLFRAQIVSMINVGIDCTMNIHLFSMRSGDVIITHYGSYGMPYWISPNMMGHLWRQTFESVLYNSQEFATTFSSESDRRKCLTFGKRMFNSSRGSDGVTRFYLTRFA